MSTATNRAPQPRSRGVGAGRSLDQTVVVLVGATSGIGRASALAFADHGARLVLAARGQDVLDEVADACHQRGAEAVAVATDAAVAAEVEALADRAIAAYGRIDVWVHAASTLIAGDLEEHPPDETQQLVDTNVIGAMNAGRAALRVFRRQGSGVLVLLSSLLGVLPNPLAPAYVASKFAVRGLGLSLRAAVAGERDIDVCVVLPGPVDTPIFDHAADHTGQDLRAIPPAASAERVAAAVVAAARRPRRQRTAGWSNRMLLVGHRLSPRLTERLVAWWSAALLTRGERGGQRGREPGDRSGSDTAGALFEPGTADAVHGGYRLGALRRRTGDALGRALARRGS